MSHDSSPFHRPQLPPAAPPSPHARLSAICSQLLPLTRGQTQIHATTTAASTSQPLSSYPYQLLHSTRFGDVDMYGHVNNVVYYSYFDTLVNTLLRLECNNQQSDDVIGIVGSSSCRYHSSLSFPQPIILALRVAQLGNASVTHDIGIFRYQDEQRQQHTQAAKDDEVVLCATGTFTHIFVSKKARMRPVPIPDSIRAQFAKLMLPTVGTFLAPATKMAEVQCASRASAPPAPNSYLSLPRPTGPPSSFVKRTPKQSTHRLVMVSPRHFCRNDQTAADNTFMQATSLSSTEIQALAQKEFDAYVQLLRAHDIDVHVFHPLSHPATPDGCYPNNWFSTHPARTMQQKSNSPDEPLDASMLILYPMAHSSRRGERQAHMIEWLRKQYDVTVDLTRLEEDEPAAAVSLGAQQQKGMYFEGTGSAIIDHVNRIIYHSVGQRSSEQIGRKIAQLVWPEDAFQQLQKAKQQVISFHAREKTAENGAAASAVGADYYHTNVMMSIGTNWCVVCLESIPYPEERHQLLASLRQTKHEIIEISCEQVKRFCGNILEVQNRGGDKFVVMSTQACNGFTAEQKQRLLKHVSKLLHTPLDTIESIGGGGARCMIAELF